MSISPWRATAASSVLIDYAAAIAAVFATVLATRALIDVAGEQNGIKALFYVAPLVVARLVGRFPGITAAVLSAAAMEYFIYGHADTFAPDWVGWWVRMASMIGAVLIVPERPARAPRGSAGRTFWTARPSGDYARDVADGAQRGQTFLLQLRGTGETHMLGWIVRDMIRAGRFGGQEIGFLEAIAVASRRAALLPHHLPQHFDREGRVIEPDLPVEAGAVGQKHLGRVELK